MWESMNIVRLDVVDSTNLYAKENLQTLPDRTVISAERQTSGRGRFDRTWVDLGDSNIFMSIVLKPSQNFDCIYTNITQYLSVVLCNVIEQYGITAEIKWPNDVLVGGKKIAGILSETVMQGSNFKGLVLGIGINLNSKISDLKTIKDKDATSLNIELSIESVNKEKFLNKLLEEFFKNYDEFLKKGFTLIRNEYLSRACFLNKEISVMVFNNRKSGIAKDINTSGELVLENDKKEFVLTMGDIL